MQSAEENIEVVGLVAPEEGRYYYENRTDVVDDSMSPRGKRWHDKGKGKSRPNVTL